MGQALYRKYRSKSLDEIVGQDHITHTLEQALKQGRISHAYLFTGPRGVGKTSIARILAHQINGLPYDENQMHMDIIEIDAASNRRIDEIRDLRDKVYIAPAQAKYKVYIIDEVHMLTREAFNALLKTLEEPPAHAIFILATTELHKVPATIVSRTQRFTFKPIETTTAANHLKAIAKQEKIKISDEALELLAEHGDGSFRDSISLLDQAAGQGSEITADVVRQMLGVPTQKAIEDLAELLQKESDNAAVMGALNALYDQGFQAAAIAKQLAAIVRLQLIAGSYHGDAPKLLSQLLEVPISHDPARFLEIILLTATPGVQATIAASAPTTKLDSPSAKKGPEPKKTAAAAPAPTLVKKTSESTQAQKVVTPASKTDPKREPTEAPDAISKDSSTPASHSASQLDEASWGQVLQELKKQYNTLYGIARMAQIAFHDDSSQLELTFKFAFHQKRMMEAKNHQILSDAILKVIGSPVEVICLVNPDVTPAKVAATTAGTAANQGGTLTDISNIFGGGELLESE